MKKKFGNILGFIFSFAMAVALFWGMPLNAFAANNGNVGNEFYTDRNFENPNSDSYLADGNYFSFTITSVNPNEVKIGRISDRKLSGGLVIPETVKDDCDITYTITEIEESCFDGWAELTQVTLPSAIKNIGIKAFQMCSKLESVNIPSGVTTIGGSAFHSTKISEITIPDSVTSIGNYCFFNAHSLQKVIMEGTTVPTAGEAFLNNTNSSLKIIVPEAYLYSYKTAEVWEGYKDKMISLPWKELQYAFDASAGDAENPASDYTTIELTKNTTAETDEAGLVIANGKKIKLDLKGFTLDRGLTEGKENGYVIKVESGAKLIITDSSTEKTGKVTGGYNTSLDYCGGGVCVEGYLELQDGSITGNKAYKGGGVGVIGNWRNSDYFKMTAGSISDNEAVKSGDYTGFGGGVYVASTAGFSMTNGKVEKNKAAADGGGIYVDHGNSDISYGSVEYNDAEGNGGGIVNAGGTLKLICGNILNNSANGNGGGIYNGDGENYSFVSFHASTIDGCSAKNGGGDYTTAKARFETGGFGGVSYIKNCIATENGGAVYTENEGTSTFSNTTISGCSAKLGGALCTDGVLGIEDVTIKECVASVNGSGIYIAGQGRIFAGKTAKIYENEKGDANNNVYIADGGIITLGSGGDVPEPASGMKLGITMEKPGIFTTNGSETQTQYFVSDVSGLNFKFIAADTFDGIDYDCMAFISTVDFETNGGSDVDSYFVISNTLISEPEAPTKADYLFKGWYSDDEFTDEFDFSSNVTSNVVLYAKWHKHNVVKVTGQQPTTTAYGWKDYYECKDSADACHEYFEDAAGKKQIADLAKWKSEGNGYLAPLDPGSDPDPDPSPVEMFVERMYVNLEDTEIEKEDVEEFANKLISGSSNGATLAKEFIEKVEYKNRDLDDEQYLEILYNAFFGRNPDEEGYEFWLSLLENGASREEVLAGFVNSAEFTDLCNDLEISRGFMLTDGTVATKGVESFVENCYKNALGRDGEQSGLDAWMNLVATGEMSAKQVVTEGFFHSEEFMSKELTDEEYVTLLYATLLGRNPEQEGFEFWLKLLEDGATRDDVLNGFANSEEFENVLVAYDI